ncbi:hypothetical protein [Sphingomonas faeni]|uniref:hypothetical protein n=1 Tax=Sphingomonas faeni TaxID=185950 RepID=UPI00335DC10D
MSDRDTRRIEHAARAMCRFHGLPENTKFEGRPMWESYVPEVKAIVAALDEADASSKAETER